MNSNVDVTKIIHEGFFLGKKDHGPTSLAEVSLKIALKAYFSTYRSMDFLLKDILKKSNTKKTGFYHTKEYCEQCCESIIHFHHFFELTLKDILRDENPLLVEDASKKPEILYKMLKGKTISEDDHEKLKSIEFDTTLNRLCTLIKGQNLGAGSLDFLVSSRQILDSLNTLRNRLLHRGIYILSYSAFDLFIGKYILPLVITITQINSKFDWKYNVLKCGIDPLEEIINEFKNDSYNLFKIAYLKELGRSAYMNNVSNDNSKSISFFDQPKIEQLEEMSNSLQGSSNVNEIAECPVCGLKTLIIYDDVEFEDYDDATNSFSNPYNFTWQARCVNCTFEINSFSLENASKYHLHLPDYWKAENY